MKIRINSKKSQKQSKRNYVINRRYIAIAKALLKIIIKQLSDLNLHKFEIDVNKKKMYILTKYNKFSSLVDKLVKKKIIHRNTGARRKSKIHRLINLSFLNIFK